MNLVVKTDSRQFFDDPEGFESSDRRARDVKAFCQAHDLPYSDTFVSIGVVGDRKQSPLNLVGERQVYNVNDQYGRYAIELNDEVIKDVQVVTIRDFQTVICAAIDIVGSHPDGREVSGYLRDKLVDLRGKTLLEKKAALKDASRRAPRAAYAEARIFRCLRTGDKLLSPRA